MCFLVSNGSVWVERADTYFDESTVSPFMDQVEVGWREGLVREEGDQIWRGIILANVRVGLDVVKLHLLGIEMGTSWAQWIGTGLSRNPPLETLCLRQCGLNDSQLHAIVQNLSQNTHLKRLDLSFNTFGPSGFVGLISSAPASLVHLNVAGNKIGANELQKPCGFGCN